MQITTDYILQLSWLSLPLFTVSIIGLVVAVKKRASAPRPSSWVILGLTLSIAAVIVILRVRTGHVGSNENQPVEVKIASMAARAADGRDEHPQRESETFDLALAARGWSRRRIARELSVDRGTVGKYPYASGEAHPFMAEFVLRRVIGEAAKAKLISEPALQVSLGWPRLRA